MHHDYTDELFETILKIAIYESSLEESADYPEKDIRKIQVSDTCDRRIKRIDRSLRYSGYFRNTARYIRRLAAIIGIALGISFTALLFNGEVRAACYNAIITFYEKYVDILIHPSSTDALPNLTVDYLPEGYALYQDDRNEYMISLIYKNKDSEQILIQYNQMQLNEQADTEHYAISDVSINSAKGNLFISLDKTFGNIIIWYTEKGTYTIIANLPEKELIKIAENIK